MDLLETETGPLDSLCARSAVEDPYLTTTGDIFGERRGMPSRLSRSETSLGNA